MGLSRHSGLGTSNSGRVALINASSSMRRPTNAPSFLLAVFILILGTTPAVRAGYIDYSIALGDPQPWEVAMATTRFQAFLSRLRPATRTLLDQTPFVAVKAREVSVADVPVVLNRLTKGTAQATSVYGSDPHAMTGNDVSTQLLLIFDVRTRALATPEGVYVVDNPGNGKIGIFHGFYAIYVK